MGGEKNNNSDKGAIENIKNATKNAIKKVAKKTAKKAFTHIIKPILPYIAGFFICLLAIGLLMAVVNSILNFFSRSIRCKC